MLNLYYWSQFTYKNTFTGLLICAESEQDAHTLVNSFAKGVEGYIILHDATLRKIGYTDTEERGVLESSYTGDISD